MKHQINRKNAKEVLPGFHGRFIHSENMTFAWWEIDAGSELPEHQHHHEQVLNMLEGKFELVLNGEAMILEEGAVVVIPSELQHSGKAITACRILDVFHPKREEYQ